MGADIETCDLLIRNAHVLTCDARCSTYAAGAVAVRGIEIAGVGAEAELAPRFRAKRIIDAGGGLVHPGLMDMHYHVTYHMVGKMIAEVELSGDDPGPWVAAQYTAMINALGDEEEYANALLCGLDMLKSGVTSIMDPGSAFEPDTIAQAADVLGFRVSVADPWIMDTKGPQLTAITRAKVDREAALAGIGRQLWRNRDDTSRVRAHISVYGMGNDSDELRLAAKAAADEAGVAFNMHQSQSIDDAEHDDRRFGRHPLVHFREIGLLGPSCVFVHMNVLREDELDPVVESGMSLVWSPTNSWYYGTRARMRTPMPALT
jgi:cytosine/adenosine deaminase-related metal-dependent hydrolase